MKNRKRICTIILILSIAIAPIALDNNALAAYTMSLNTRYGGSIYSQGMTVYYHFTPPTTGVYTVETFGNLDTVLTFPQYSWSTLSNDNSGVGQNAKIGFSVTNADNLCEFQLSTNYGAVGSYSIQVRQQKMVIFAGEYSDINTLPDIGTPATQMLANGYRISTFENATQQQAQANDDTGVPAINSEIIFFTGHGNSSSIRFSDGSRIFSNTLPSLDRTKVAVWAGCNTGEGTESFAESAYDQGALVSIGWTTTLSPASSKIFTDSFFEELKKDRNVQDACDTAASKLLWPWDGAKNYVIFGPTNYVLLPQVTWYTSTNTQAVEDLNAQTFVGHTDSVNEAEFAEALNQYEYFANQLSDDCTRYIKMIDGRLTNDFYDVYETGVITKSENTISSIEIANLAQISNSSLLQSICSSPEKEGYIIIGTEVHNVYVKYNEDVIPVRIVGTTYQDVYGCNIIEYSCVNELTGFSINYEDISFVN